ncbi:winged helix-turn-helix transcriptional regulator [Candidatus Micrarchaeota archaeon]|nr:winged helix-turn-helix transcriptional regulator [Candidatus Micrarchaeota archaeon]
METSLFVEFFGDTPFIRVVDFLIENSIFDYTKTEIAENAGVSRASLYKVWAVLEGYGIVKESRRIGNTTLYKLNSGNAVVKKLIEVDLKINKEFAETLVNKQIAVRT